MLNLYPWTALGGGLSSLQCMVLYLFHSIVTRRRLIYCGFLSRKRPSVSQGTQSSKGSSSYSKRLYFQNQIIYWVMKSIAPVESLMIAVLSKLWFFGSDKFSSSFSLLFSNQSLKIFWAIICRYATSCYSVVMRRWLTRDTAPRGGEIGSLGSNSSQFQTSSCCSGCSSLQLSQKPLSSVWESFSSIFCLTQVQKLSPLPLPRRLCSIVSFIFTNSSSGLLRISYTFGKKAAFITLSPFLSHRTAVASTRKALQKFTYELLSFFSVRSKLRVESTIYSSCPAGNRFRYILGSVMSS